MTLAEAEKKFNLSMETLKQYVSFGLIRAKQSETHSEDYRDQDFERLGLIETLMSAGFTAEETRKYLSLTENMGTDEEQIRMLRKHRYEVLDDIHKRQQILDQLDFMIWNKKKEEKK